MNIDSRRVMDAMYEEGINKRVRQIAFARYHAGYSIAQIAYLFTISEKRVDAVLRWAARKATRRALA